MLTDRKRGLSSLLRPVLIAGICLAASISQSPEAFGATRVKKLVYTVRQDHARLFFDAEGDRPKNIRSSAEGDGLIIEFTSLAARPKNRTFDGPGAPITSLVYREASGGPEAVISYRGQGITASHQFQGSKQKGGYKLVLTFAKGKSAALSKGVKPETPAAVPAPTLPAQPAGPEAQAPELFEKADNSFLEHRGDLASVAKDLMVLYAEALKAAPKSQYAPTAIYRLGLVQLAAGSPSKAERSFTQAIIGWPEHPISISCRLEMGNLYLRKQSFLEAMEAFRSAQRLAADKAEKLEASLGLGRTYALVGAHKEALETLNQCVAQDPALPLKRPEIIRFLGEAYFAAKQYDKSREYLLKYLNLQQDGHEKDLILAKLAEISLIQGESALADNLYHYIRKYYPDSDGDFACRIRQAEMLEKSGQKGMEDAQKIYDELCTRNISQALRRVVNFKQASLYLRRGNLEKSLDAVEEAFQGNPDTASQSEFAALREQVLCEMAKKYAAEKNPSLVVQLHQKYWKVFNGLQGPELAEVIAESYAALGFHANALDLYERLVNGSKKKNEDWVLKCAQYALESGLLDKSLGYCGQIQSGPLEAGKSAILGRLHFREKRYAEAVKYFGKAAQKGKESELDADVGRDYAQCLVELKRYDEALLLLQKGLEKLAPDDAEKRYGLLTLQGKCQMELKQQQKAIDVYESALPLASESQANGLIYDISNLYLALGQKEKAMQTLTRLIGSASAQSFWKAAAQQQFNSIQMVQGGK